MHVTRITRPGGWQYWLSDNGPAASSIFAAVESESAVHPDYLKSLPSVRVYVAPSADGQREMVVKKFLLSRLVEKLKHRRRGPREFANHVRAVELGLPVPAIYACFQRRRHGLVDTNGVVLEFLRGWKPLPVAEFSLAVPLLLRLFELGVNHVDVTPANVLAAADSGELRLLDWESCSFGPPRDVRQLLHAAAHHIELSGLGYEHPAIRDFLDTLFRHWQPADVTAASFHQAVRHLTLHHQGGKTRLALRVDAETMAMLRNGIDSPGGPGNGGR